MKRFFLICLIVLIAAVALVLAIEYDPGYLLISYGLYTLETTVWVGLVALLIVSSLVTFFMLGGFRLLRGGFALNRWFINRSQRRSQMKSIQGAIAFIEGNWQQSRRLLTASASKAEAPLFNYLFAARASYEMGDDKETRELLNKAEASTSGASIAVQIAQAQMSIESQKWEECLAILTRVRRNAGKHPYVLKLLKQAYLGLDDWQGLADLLADLLKYRVIDKAEFERLSLRCAIAKLELAVIATDKQQAAAALSGVWQAQSKVIQTNSGVVACYARCLVQLGDQVSAEKVIAKQLKQEWSEPLIGLYGRIAGADISKQLLQAEHWLRERNNDASLLLCLGRLSLRNQLWGKAREYFENSHKMSHNSEACAELGRLLSQLGEYEKGNAYFQQGLLLSTHGLPELPMPAAKIH